MTLQLENLSYEIISCHYYYVIMLIFSITCSTCFVYLLDFQHFLGKFNFVQTLKTTKQDIRNFFGKPGSKKPEAKKKDKKETKKRPRKSFLEDSGKFT